MSKGIDKIVKIIKDILLGFKIAEENRNKSGFGKF
jgi:hypothetical protein